MKGTEMWRVEPKQEDTRWEGLRGFEAPRYGEPPLNPTPYWYKVGEEGLPLYCPLKHCKRLCPPRRMARFCPLSILNACLISRGLLVLCQGCSLCSSWERTGDGEVPKDAFLGSGRTWGCLLPGGSQMEDLGKELIASQIAGTFL